MNGFWEVFPVIIIFPTFGLAFKWYLDYRTRRQLIEKGLVDEKIKYLQFNGMQNFAPSSLKWGLIFLLVGLTIVIMRAVSEDIPDEVILGSMLIAAGAGLLIYYKIADMARKKHERQIGH